MNDNFWAGFEKQAGLPGMLGSLAGKLQKAPAAATKMVKNIPATIKGGVDAVKNKMARNAQELSASRARELGKGVRAARPALDLSAKAAKGRIATGVRSPESLRQAKGTLLGRAQSAGTALAVGGAGGIYYGMKEPENGQQR